MQNKYLYLELLFFLCNINEGLIVIANVEKDKGFTTAESFICSKPGNFMLKFEILF